MKPFEIERIDSQGNMTILKIQGYIDAHTASEMENTLSQLLKDNRFQVIIDFASLEYISSAGLGIFMAFIRLFREKKGDIRMCAMRENVYHIFELLGFPSIFKIFKTIEEAEKSFTNNQKE